MACILFLMKNKPYKASIAFGVAFSFKLQSIFFAPVLLIFVLKRRICIRHLILIPVTYIVSILPALLVGRPLGDLLTIYFRQTGTYSSSLTANAPSLLSLLSENLPAAAIKWITVLSIVLCGVIVLTTIAFINKNLKIITPQQTLFISSLFLLCVPWLLPRMHERYFYPAAIGILIKSVIDPVYRISAALEGLCIVYIYERILFGFPLVWSFQSLLRISAIILGGILVQIYVKLLNDTRILKSNDCHSTVYSSEDSKRVQ